MRIQRLERILCSGRQSNKTSQRHRNNCTAKRNRGTSLLSTGTMISANNTKGRSYETGYHLSRNETADAARTIGVALIGKARQHKTDGRRRRVSSGFPFAL